MLVRPLPGLRFNKSHSGKSFYATNKKIPININLKKLMTI